MILPIRYYNDPVLRLRGEPVEEFDKALRTLALDMTETMRDADGIGIAAQQVGLDLQLCVVDVRGAKEPYTCELDGREQPPELVMPLYLANPEIVEEAKETTVYEEGCLSLPDIRAEVERPGALTVKYQDLEGKERTLRCDGILARCVQHEVDHLQGKLFIDHLPAHILTGLAKKLKKLKRQTKEEMKERRREK